MLQSAQCTTWALNALSLALLNVTLPHTVSSYTSYFVIRTFHNLSMSTLCLWFVTCLKKLRSKVDCIYLINCLFFGPIWNRCGEHVSFMLHDLHVRSLNSSVLHMSQITVKTPDYVLQFILSYSIFLILHVMHTIKRRFSWSRCSKDGSFFL